MLRYRQTDRQTDRQDEYGQIDAYAYTASEMLTESVSYDLKAVVSPGGELHGAVLLVEREVLDVDGARAAEYDHRQPRDVAVRRHDDVGADGRLV